MGAGGYVDETREAGGQSLWASAWSGEACPPFVHSGCPCAERSEPSGREAIIHISTGPGFLVVLIARAMWSWAGRRAWQQRVYPKGRRARIELVARNHFDDHEE